MTSDKQFELIRVKIDRAKKHYSELETEVRSFLASDPYQIGIKRGSVYYVKSVRKTPIGISAILGDIINNLRSALDQLAYQLVWIGTKKIPASHVYFPIADDAKSYPPKRDKYLKGALSEAIAEIDALHPYKGGNDILWKLHKLANIDKHRALVTTGSAFRSINLGAFIFRNILGFGSPDSPFENFPVVDAFFRPADRMFPLKEGDELFVGPVDNKLEFRFDMAFGEPNINQGDPLLETLQQMINHVDEIIHKFKPFLF